MALNSPPAPLSPAFPDALLPTLLDLSLSAVNLLRPVYGPAGAIVDFTLDYLNPAAQRMSQLPERPAGTLLTLRPTTADTGILDYYRRAFETDAAEVFEVNYQAEGLDNFFRLAARRCGEWLVVSFTDTGDQPRTPVENALREAQAAEKAARADAEAQRNELRDFVEYAPVAVAVYRGPEYRVELANATTLAIWGRALPDVLGRPVFEVLPEADTPDVRALFDRVFATGVPHTAIEQPTRIHRHGRQETVYWNFVFQPEYQPDGRIGGIRSVGTEVTDQVRARQQVEQMNQELESHVQARAQEALALQADVLAAARQQAQERERFYQIFAQTPAAICIQRGPEHRYEYANQSYQDFFPGRELLGRPVAEALPETVDSDIIALLDRVYQTGETYFGEELPLLVAQPEGPPRQMYFTFTYQALREDGEIVGISTFAHNVAEQVLARQQREAERQQLLRLFTEAPAAICILAGPELVFEFVNPAYQQLVPGRELLGRSTFEALPEIVGTPVETMLRGVFATGRPHQEQGLLIPVARAADGVLEDRYFSFVYQGRRDAHGQVDGALVFAFEVTEQVQARQAAEASARQLRLLTDALPVLIGYLDREEKYRFANRAYEPWFGLTPVELFGRPIREVAGEAAYPVVRPYIERALAGELVEFDAEMPFRPGVTKHIRTSYVPDVQAGEVAGFYTLVSDVTEQVEARRAVERSARELAAANEQLTRTNVDLDNFIYTASHDLKAPITNIEGLLDTLRHELPEPAPTDEVGYILGLMQESVERFKRTIDHLTDVSKLQKEHGPPTAQVLLLPVLEDVRQDLAPLLQQTGGKLRVRVADCPPLRFSEKNLRSVLYNLLSNALKYRHPDRAPEVHVRCRQADGCTVLEVQDNGLGLDLTREKQLFAMFQRLHTHVEGSGLGLYMVKRMVENAVGKITVHSQVGEGTTFSVYFPC